MTYDDFKAQVLKSLTDREPSDDQFVQALSYWVKAHYSRDVLKDMTGFGSYKGSYDTLRIKLVGYTPILSLASLKTATKDYISDAESETLFVSAISKFVKGRIYQEVDRNPQMAAAMFQGYYSDRLRLVGRAYSGVTPLADKVREYLPADKDRQNVQTFIDTCIEEARLDLIELGLWVDDRIDKAYDDLTGLDTFIDEQLRQALLDLQHYIPYFRENNVEILEKSDFTQVGLGCKASMPDGVLKEVYLRYSQDQELRPVGEIAWTYRHAITYESCNCSPIISIKPDGSEFYLYPNITGDATAEQVILVWEGEKYDYSGSDIVPFDNATARVVASYVLAKLFHESVESNPTARTHYDMYAGGRRRLFTNLKRRTRLDGETISCSLPSWTIDTEENPLLPTFDTQPSDDSVAAPAASSFTVAVTSTGDTTYNWEVSSGVGVDFVAVTDVGVYSGSSTATLAISNSTGLNDYVFRCKVTNYVGSVYSDEATLTVT